MTNREILKEMKAVLESMFIHTYENHQEKINLAYEFVIQQLDKPEIDQDAPYTLTRLMQPIFSEYGLQKLPTHQIYVDL